MLRIRASQQSEPSWSVLLAYRAVYSLLTSNAYSEMGTDGHFEWCVAMLQRATFATWAGMAKAGRQKLPLGETK